MKIHPKNKQDSGAFSGRKSKINRKGSDGSSKDLFVPIVPTLLAIVFTFGLVGNFLSPVNSEAVEDNSSTTIETEETNTPSPTNSSSGSGSSSDSDSSGDEGGNSSGTDSSDSGANEDFDAASVEAQSYYEQAWYCRAELIQQLQVDGFTYNAAVYGVDSLGVDWLEEASGKAWSLFEDNYYTYEEMIAELINVGCTLEEAEYGAAGLEY